MPINPPTRVLLSLMQKPNFSSEDTPAITALIARGANLIIRDSNGDNAYSLAIKSNQPNVMDFFKNINPEYFNNKVREMQAMWIIGKEKDGVFSASEMDRTQMDEIEKGLDLSSPKTEGLEKGEIATQSIAKREGKAPTSYMLKKAINCSIQHLREVIGARCYAYFAGSKGTIIAKTRLVTRAEEDTSYISSDEEDISETSSGESLFFAHPNPPLKIDLGSRILPQSFVQYSRDNGPRINSAGRIVVSVNNIDQEVKGYLSAMMVAKFIQDFDCDGFGNNDGYMITDTGVQNAKIDPGKALGFMDDVHADITDVSEGITILLTYKIFGDEYRTFIPLEYLDLNNITQLRPEISVVSDLLKTYYPELDVRDPVIGKITYAEVCNSPKLHHEFAETIYDIVICSEDNLYHLINHNLPESINYLPIGEEQDRIFEQLALRQQVMHKLYPREVEYMKTYREIEASSHSTNFEAIIQTMAVTGSIQPEESALIFDQNALIDNHKLSDEITEVSKKLLHTAKMIKLNPEEFQQKADVIQRAEMTISLINSRHSQQQSLNHAESSSSSSWVSRVRRSPSSKEATQSKER